MCEIADVDLDHYLANCINAYINKHGNTFFGKPIFDYTDEQIINIVHDYSVGI